MNNWTLGPKRHYAARFRGSRRLFDACWRKWRERYQEGIEEAASDHDVMVALNWHASQKVNDSRSVFYLHG